MSKSAYTGRYELTTEEYRTAYWYAMRYNGWKDKHGSLLGLRGRKEEGGGRRGISDPTARAAIKAKELKEKMELIETTAKEADAELYAYILKAVTNRGIGYDYLDLVMNIPCGRDKFYDRRRKFYFLLSEKI